MAKCKEIRETDKRKSAMWKGQRKELNKVTTRTRSEIIEEEENGFTKIIIEQPGRKERETER